MNDTMQVIQFLISRNNEKDTQIQMLTQQIDGLRKSLQSLTPDNVATQTEMKPN